MAAGFGSIGAPLHLEVICWGSEWERGGLPEMPLVGLKAYLQARSPQPMTHVNVPAVAI